MNTNRKTNTTIFFYILGVVFFVSIIWIYAKTTLNIEPSLNPEPTNDTNNATTTEDATQTGTVQKKTISQSISQKQQQKDQSPMQPTTSNPKTTTKNSVTCAANECSYKNTCHKLPQHGHCAKNDPQNARLCDTGYRDTGTSCVKKTTPTTTNTTHTGPKNIMGYDIYSDSSITKFVGKDHSFNTISYAPMVVKIVPSQTITTKGNQYLRPEAYNALTIMSEAFFADVHAPIHVISSYRSYHYQKNNISQSCKNSGRCAREGESEHQSGLAMDLWSLYPNQQSRYAKQVTRLKNNAHKYGWHQSYQKGKSIDGYNQERRHWRYVGAPLATYLHNNSLTFSQLYKQ